MSRPAQTAYVLYPEGGGRLPSELRLTIGAWGPFCRAYAHLRHRFIVEGFRRKAIKQGQIKSSGLFSMQCSSLIYLPAFVVGRAVGPQSRMTFPRSHLPLACSEARQHFKADSSRGCDSMLVDCRRDDAAGTRSLQSPES